MIRPSIAMVAALLLAGCASTPAPTGPMSVIIRHPFNILSAGVFEAPVFDDGSFANEIRNGNSSVSLVGRVDPAKRGDYEVTFNYQATMARALNAVDSKSMQATVITRPNDPQPVGDILIKKDGRRHLGAADDISLELQMQAPATTPEG